MTAGGFALQQQVASHQLLLRQIAGAARLRGPLPEHCKRFRPQTMSSTTDESGLYLKIDNGRPATADVPSTRRREEEVYLPPSLPRDVGRTVLRNWIKGFYFGYGIEVLPHVVSLIFRGRKQGVRGVCVCASSAV